MKTQKLLSAVAIAVFVLLTFLTSMMPPDSVQAPPSFPPPPPPPPMWGTSNSMMNGGPWGPGAFSGPYYNNGVGFNSGVSKVVGVGYDARGVWQTIPMVVHWVWNGFFYNFTVRDAWNPWTRMWNIGVGEPAYQTDYTLRGVSYKYYVNLSTGTYYFNP